jgi:tetratricopeptide (TPR) repeat protein
MAAARLMWLALGLAAGVGAGSGAEAELRFSAQARQHLEERRRWHRGVVEHPAATPAEKAEAEGELGILYHAYGLLVEAERQYTKAAAAAPQDFRWHYYLGEALRAQSRLAESRLAFQAARGLAPNDLPAAVREGEVLLDLGQTEAAGAALRRALEIDSTCAAAHFALGLIDRQAGAAAAAAARFETVLRLQPAASAVRHPLAIAYRDLGRAAAARAELAAAGTARVTLRDPLMERVETRVAGRARALAEGDRALAAGQVAAATAAYRAAVAADPLASEARVRLAGAALRQGDRPGAEEQLALALRLAPQSAGAHRQLAHLRWADGRLAEAIDHCRAVLATEPDDEPARWSLGQLLLESGRAREAATEFARLTAARPASALGWLGEATAQVHLGRCAGALASLAAGLEQLPGDARLNQGLARLLAGCPDGARRDGRRALELAAALWNAEASPEHGEAVAMALAELGRPPQAVAWQRRAIALAEAGEEEWLLPQLRANLEAFASGVPVAEPWSARFWSRLATR